MNRNWLAAAVFAALTGLALAGATPGRAATPCAEAIAEFRAEWAKRERWAHDPYVVNMHVRAAEKALREGDEKTCLTEVGLARVQMLADEPERPLIHRR